MSVSFGEQFYDIQLAYVTCHSTSFFVVETFQMGNYERLSLRNSVLSHKDVCDERGDVDFFNASRKGTNAIF